MNGHKKLLNFNFFKEAPRNWYPEPGSLFALHLKKQETKIASLTALNFKKSGQFYLKFSDVKYYFPYVHELKIRVLTFYNFLKKAGKQRSLRILFKKPLFTTGWA